MQISVKTEQFFKDHHQHKVLEMIINSDGITSTKLTATFTIKDKCITTAGISSCHRRLKYVVTQTYVQSSTSYSSDKQAAVHIRLPKDTSMLFKN